MKPYIKSISFKLGNKCISGYELKKILKKKKYTVDRNAQVTKVK